MTWGPIQGGDGNNRGRLFLRANVRWTFWMMRSSDRTHWTILGNRFLFLHSIQRARATEQYRTRVRLSPAFYKLRSRNTRVLPQTHPDGFATTSLDSAPTKSPPESGSRPIWGYHMSSRALDMQGRASWTMCLDGPHHSYALQASIHSAA